MNTYRVIQLEQFGGPEVLTVATREVRPLGAGEVRVRSLASAVNFSDAQIRKGDWKIRKANPFPYVPGLEVVGDVVEVADGVSEFRVGDRVWTMMQGLGGVRAERDGGYAELVTVGASALAQLPRDVDPVKFAALGLAGVTALESLRLVGDVRGKTVLVTGTNGGVGGAALKIAAALGANVVAQNRSSAPAAPESVDAVLDGVGGPGFAALIAALRPGGRYCTYGAAAGGDVRFDLWGLIEPRTLTGYSSETLTGETLRRATMELLRLTLAETPATLLPLREAARAHSMLENREVQGRIVLVPGS